MPQSSHRPAARPVPNTSTARSDHPPAHETASTPPRILRSRAVCERTGLSRTTLWRLERIGAFPLHRRISANAVGWLEEEVTAWIRSRR